MSPAPDVLTRPWPLTGRHELLEEVCASLAGGCPAHFVLGEAGSGKTRLAREVLARMEADGWVVAGATASESAGATPLGALAHLVPGSAPASPPTLFQATVAAIAERTGGRPLILHVDDAHHLDASSASLLVSLAEADAARLVLTMRSGLRAPDAIMSLRSAHRVESVTLQGLDPVAIDTLLHRVLGAPLDGVAEAELVETSGGNPLYLRELVLSAVAEGALEHVAGVWRLRGSLTTSDALGAQALGRMAVLGEGSRDALELIAVGEPVGLDLLESLVDGAILEDLEQRGLIRVDQDQRRCDVRLAHPVYGEILRRSLGRVRIRRLSRLHAEALSATGARRRDDALRLVRFQLAAGTTPDVDVVMTGARLARHHQDWATTASLSRAALDAGHADAAALLVEAHFALGEFDEGDAITDEVLGDPSRLSEEAFVSLHRTRADSLFFAHDDAAGAVDDLAAVTQQVADPLLRELLLFSRAAMLAWSARLEEALDLVEGLLSSDEPRVAVQAALVVEVAAATGGPTGRAIELADEWFPIHVSLPDLAGTNTPGFHMIIKAVALANAGRLVEARELAELGYGASVAARSVVGQLWFALELGRIALLGGDVTSAERWFREQVAVCRGTGWRRPVTLGLSGLAVVAAHRGDAAAAAAAIAERDATGLSVIELFAVEGVRGDAWALAAAGDASGARRVLIEGAEAAERSGIALMGAFARFDAVRLGDTRQGPALAAAAATADSAIIDLAARWAAAPNDGAALDAVAAGFEELGCLMFAAEALAAAATAWRRSGEPRRATADERAADALIRRCRGANTPTLTTVESVVPLTAREREIVLLVADGLSTKEVAERLFLSARTVSNHLQNAYTKLGISKRSELAAALKQLGAEGGPSA
jgi:DNA-binding CsgD family transcriptional regulator